MQHTEFQPRTAVREEKRQANEALGRSFCKTLAEPITNSDASAKRNFKIPQASGLVDRMLAVAKGSQLDTAALRAELLGRYPKRTIVAEVVTAKSSGRPVNEVVVIDQAEGMSAAELREALEDIAGDRSKLSHGMPGRNLFGRGLSDVMRAHCEPEVQTFNGQQLAIARGEWRKKEGWWIELDYEDAPRKASFKKTFLDPASTGTAVRFVIADRKRCHIPDPSDIGYRLANFYMLRLIASDPNVLRLSADESFNQVPVVESPTDPRLLLAGAAAAALALGLWVGRRRTRPLLFGVAFFLGAFAVTANVLFPIGTIKAERLAYLPSFGWCLACAFLCLRLLPAATRVRVAAFAALLVLLGARTWVRNADWADNLTLFERTVATSPNSARAHNNVGALYGQSGRYADAIVHYREALRILPDYPLAAAGLARATELAARTATPAREPGSP
jgi:tetratricopeptide (TPR) repeat protein